MDFDEALEYLLRQADLERDPSRRQVDSAFQLDRMRGLLDRLGRPDEGRLTIHVAGSKGKGSTASMIAAILQTAGFRTGLYTSPHLHSFRERIAVDGEPISETEFARTVEAMQPAAEAESVEGLHGRITTFELLTALAFACFDQNQCDAQVIEVGLGGRLDATNALARKDICVITPISLEHTEILGPTVELVAGEKAGIFKAGAGAVIAPQRYTGAHAVLAERARTLSLPVIDVATELRWERTGSFADGQAARVEHGADTFEFRLPLLGAHQLENAATAIAATLALRRRGVAVASDAIERGLARVSWPGRLEVVGTAPLIVLDGAHNGDSAARLRESLRDYFQYERLTLIIGVGRDKDVDAIADELAPIADRVICTRSSHPRAAEPHEVAPAFRRHRVAAEVVEDLGAAVAAARQSAGPGDLICVMGSLFVVADARELLVTTPLTAGYAR